MTRTKPLGGMGTRPKKYPKNRLSGIAMLDVAMSIAAISMLLAILAPAVEQSRESSRLHQCEENLYRLGEAFLEHHEKIGHLPTGGWGWTWVGDPDRGTGQNQPGGWVYNILPYIDQIPLHNLGNGTSESVKRLENARRSEIALPLFNCPSRREFQKYPFPNFKKAIFPNTNNSESVAKSDYASCLGDNEMFVMGANLAGPPSFAAGDSPNFWSQQKPIDFTGVGGIRSMIRLADITDGLSNTYMIGEKSLNGDMYKTGLDAGDDLSMYCGFDNDIYRSTSTPLLTDMPGYSDSWSFGSPHPYGCLFVFCDGSVRNVSNEMDSDLHRRLGNRKDGDVVDLSEYSHPIEFGRNLKGR
jgi:hypothetical protein